MRYLLFILSFILIINCKNAQESKEVSKGISLTLAKSRKKQLSDVVYNLNFSIPKEKEKNIHANLEINFTLKDTVNDIIIDFNEKTNHLQEINVNQKRSEINHKKEHLIIDKKVLKFGRNKINISFLAGELSLNRNDEYLYTLLVPDRASTLFPCFDQPDLKAHYNLTITAPKNWKVLTGAHEKSRITKNEFTEYKYEKTDKMSTYLFSFIAGEFIEKTDQNGPFPMRFLYRETNQEKINESIPTIFKTHQNSISFLEDYTNHKFPFQKMDFATLPPFQYGGMEHTGAIQYRQSLLFLDKSATITSKLRRAKLIAHETSHMWFGNLVTMKWFDDVWLKEVFANFMADKIMNPVFPKINHDLNFLMSHYPSAYSEDRTKGTNPIKQHLDNLKNAGGLYGRIIYNKAPIMMRQLELVMGTSQFQKGIQKYIANFANSNADWSDLVNIFDDLSEKNIKEWSNTWVKSSGRPIISDSIIYENGKIKDFFVKQKAEDKSSKVWNQFFSIGLKYDDEIKILDVNLNKELVQINNAKGLPKPREIIYNYNGIGYGVFPFGLLDINSIKNDVARGHSFINLYENMLLGKIPVTNALETYIYALKHEKNELILNYICGRVNTIYWTFLTNQTREKYSKISEVLYSRLVNGGPDNIQKTLFSILKNISNHKSGKEILYLIWERKIEIKNLNLNENDFTNLAIKLAIYKHPEASSILDKQLKKISNKDKKERFLWLLPSLSSDENVRDNFMISLNKAENREKESWVGDALTNINHPLRHGVSTKYLPQILDLLEEVQLTGDIFFPKRWLSNSIGHYSSSDALERVDKFISLNKNYNPILLKKLLIVTDNLKRAQTIKE
ncbi:M1 family aminopeptidase [Tenacibaculum sp. C7A-26P2]|uniref:M1 family aminopeptidase n=1 Tax=Tenacibaculum sp. C7A-26P2 TaxID=3447504 RepID=UPI003F842BE9